MRPIRPVIVLAVAASLASGAGALDLQQAWQGAQQHAPDAAQARAAREAGAARAEQARALWRPNVSLEGAASYASSETATRGARFSAPGFGQADGAAFDNSVTGGAATRYGLVLRQPSTAGSAAPAARVRTKIRDDGSYARIFRLVIA